MHLVHSCFDSTIGLTKSTVWRTAWDTPCHGPALSGNPRFPTASSFAQQKYVSSWPLKSGPQYPHMPQHQGLSQVCSMKAKKHREDKQCQHQDQHLQLLCAPPTTAAYRTEPGFFRASPFIDVCQNFGLREATVIIGDQCLAFRMQFFPFFNFKIVFCLRVKIHIFPHP